MIDNNPTLLTPLQDDKVQRLTYSDGELFKEDLDYMFDVDALDQDCFYLKQSANYELRGGGCSKTRGFICEWKSE